ncbi:MAG TPA: ATP-dependent helicase [Candidatus Saccharimonadales bacterium]|jgi:superfamily I DNA/RNA helicase|nr:ATP-dependent helicase [Candidatus Saccharimonadales bacterium]
MQFLDELNDQQRLAAEAGDGPVLIIAGPGTGKTKTLTARIAYVLRTGRAQPSEILALTFTKKAAEEMASRVAALVTQTPRISTFHALCQELLGAEEPFVSEPARIQIIKGLSKPPSLKGLSSRELGLLISRAKNMADDDPAVIKLTHAYDKALHSQGLRDFDDLLVKTRNLLQGDDAARQVIQERYKYIFVDEFQDTNKLQYELLQLLRGNDNLFVIGDPNQSIYGFRGASGSIFAQFMTDFPDGTRITLTANYRSVPQVVALANNIFTADAPLIAQTNRPGSVRAVQVLNEYSEANWVTAEIQRAIGGGDMLRAVSDDDRNSHRTLRDFAILYRSRSAATTMQKIIDESGLPYQIVGEGSPYEQPQAQALIALLRAAATGDTPELEGFTAHETRAVQDLLAQYDGASPSKLAERLIGILGFEQTASLRQFSNALVRFSDLRQAIVYFDTIAETHFYDPKADAVTLLTIHAAKGLEFPYVFLVAAEEGILPHAKANEDEERRLFYVAVTRARDALVMTHTKNRGGQPAQLSRFAQGVAGSVLPKTVDPNLVDDARRAQKRATKRSQQSLF